MNWHTPTPTALDGHGYVDDPEAPGECGQIETVTNAVIVTCGAPREDHPC